MKILFFILSLAVFRPLTAQAEPVFNDTETFLMAKAVRLSRPSGGSTSPLTGVASDSKQNVYGGDKSKKCATNKRRSGNSCVACPANGKCNGTTTWYCYNGYWQDTTAGKESCFYCDPALATCRGTDTNWKCKGEEGTTWKLSYALKTNASSAKGCVACNDSSRGGDLAVCNGSDTYHCKGYATSKAWNTGFAYKKANDSKCTACPSNFECSGYDAGYGVGFQCYGVNANTFDSKYKLAGSSYKSTVTDVSKVSCTDCPTGAVCNGKTEYFCDSTHYRRSNNSCNDATKISNVDSYGAEPTSTPHTYSNFSCKTGYFRANSSNQTGSSDFNSCAEALSNLNCETGFKKQAANGNTVYCVQDDNKSTVASFSNNPQCPPDMTWLDERKESKGPYGSNAVIWPAGCYPKGNCTGDGYACMIVGFNNGNPERQCKKKRGSSTGYTGIACSI